jgi:hypothetical protein
MVFLNNGEEVGLLGSNWIARNSSLMVDYNVKVIFKFNERHLSI